VSFNDMLNDFQQILDRDDCSTAQATTFLQQGMSRIQRDCRLPSMERAVFITPTTDPMTYFPVPLDLIQPIDILVPTIGGTSKPLVKLPYRELLRISPLVRPQAYSRYQGVYQIRGALAPGDQLQFLYYGNFSDFATPDSENELSASTPDLGVYAALSYAGDNYQHPNTDRWEARYQEIKAEVMQMGYDLDAEGGPQSIQPLYNWDA